MFRSQTLTAQTNNRNRRPTVLSFRHIQGSLGQRHDIYPQAWESDCGTYEKTTESRARAERWEHHRDRLHDRRFPALHVKRAIEDGRRTRICRVFLIHYRLSFFSCHALLSFSLHSESCSTSKLFLGA